MRFSAIAFVFASFLPCLTEAGQIKLLTDETVEYTKVVKIEPNGITVETKDGVRKLRFEVLTEGDRKKYDLNKEDSDAHNSRIETNKAQAAKAAAEKDAAWKEAEEARKQKVSATPRLATVEKVKNYWLKNFPQPGSLDADFIVKKATYTKFVEQIRGGEYDLLASKAMLEWNVSEYDRTGAKELATKARSDLKATLDALQKREQLREQTRLADARLAVEREKNETAKRQVESLNRINAGLQDLERELRIFRYSW